MAHYDKVAVWQENTNEYIKKLRYNDPDLFCPAKLLGFNNIFDRRPRLKSDINDCIAKNFDELAEHIKMAPSRALHLYGVDRYMYETYGMQLSCYKHPTTGLYSIKPCIYFQYGEVEDTNNTNIFICTYDLV